MFVFGLEASLGQLFKPESGKTVGGPRERQTPIETLDDISQRILVSLGSRKVPLILPHKQVIVDRQQVGNASSLRLFLLLQLGNNLEADFEVAVEVLGGGLQKERPI